jgi:hypothetical protein
MNGLFLSPAQMVKEEQYKDLLREAEHYRLIRALSQPRVKHLQQVAAAPRPAMAGPTCDVPSLRPAS